MKKSLGNRATLIIACRNEADIIADCLDSVLAQDYPKNLLDIFVIDGMSDDGTRDILKNYSKKNSNLRILDNKNITQPYAFNMGIKASSGDYIFIMGAHSKYPKDYVSKCLKYAEEYKVDNVGGRIEAKTNKKDIISQAIIGTYTSPFGIGNATFRKNTKKPVQVDTVFGGCYRRDVFDRFGLYNETLKRGQDIELNLRIVRSGGKILLVPSIVSEYYPKTGLFDFVKYNIKAGKGPIRVMRITGKPLKIMHYIPGLFVLGLFIGPLTLLFDLTALLFWFYLAILGAYISLSLYFSAKYAIAKKNFLLFFVMPSIFFIKHFFYGVGTIIGVFKLND